MKPAEPFSKRFISSLLKLARVGNLIIIGLAQYFTAIFLVELDKYMDLRLFFLTISTIMVAAAGYVINDYYDIKIDLINRPERVVIGRNISRRYAILLHILLSAGGVLIGLFLSPGIGAINLFCVFLLWWYSNYLKRQPFIGNVSVALLTALSILVVDALYPTHHNLVWIYATFAFFMTLVREIVKDMEDLKGDNSFGCKTLPIVWGLRRTKIVIYLVLLIFCATVVLINRYLTRLPFDYFLIALLIPLLIFTAVLIKADMKKEFARLSTFCKIILILGIISMAFIR